MLLIIIPNNEEIMLQNNTNFIQIIMQTKKNLNQKSNLLNLRILIVILIMTLIIILTNKILM